MPVTIDPSTYPTARRDETIVDDYHGTQIADPYRWMEDPDSEETKRWVDELNAVSEPFISSAPCREQLRTRMTELWNYEKYTCNSKRGDFYYYSYNSGLQNQYVLFQQKSLGEKGTVFLDPNTLSDDGTTAIRTSAWSKNGSIYAYGLSEKGSDWVTIKFRCADGTDLSDVVSGVKHSSISWIDDKTGIFYCKYPEHKGAAEGTSVEKHEFHSLYYHKMGTEMAEDILVYDDRSNPDFMMGAEVSHDGRYLIIDVSRGCDPYNMIYYVDLKEHGPITGRVNAKPLFAKLDAKYEFIDNDGDKMLIQTNRDAPMYKLVRINVEDPEKWEVMLEEHPRNKLEWVAPVTQSRLVVSYLEDVKTTMYVHEYSSGAFLYQLPLEIGSVGGFFGRKSEEEMFFTFENFLTPTVIYHLDFTGLAVNQAPEVKEIRRVALNGIDTNEFTTKQVFYNSKDGTRVPMFIVSRKGIELDGTNPTILNGYGGFNISDLPCFSVPRLAFVKYMNGIIATANIRGGGEYGEKWHEGGMKSQKQNVFDDFIAAAEYLIENKYTNQKKLAIHGGSNGGLLVGACSQQRPDLYAAVINRVGVLDMLRYHKFTIGGAWVPEFGSPDDADDFKYISKYSPLHNISFPSECQWPSTLLMTADHDDRVVPSHTLKYIAELYKKAKLHPIQQNALLARVEVKAGHGQGKPTSKIIAEYVDMYCFLQQTLGIDWCF